MATAFSSLVGSGSGGGVRQYEFITSSKTFVCTATGTLDIMLIGGHASGGAIVGSGFVGGSGAGGVAVKRTRVTKGDSYIVTIGAGGMAVTRAGAGLTPGIAGGTSSVTGPGVSITATGGQPGEAKTTKPANGGLGGVGTGGDENRQSGSGGSVIAMGGSVGICGAGAVNVLGVPFGDLRGGNINTSNASPLQLTGGGGVGGRGGDVLGAAIGITAGGGSGGPAQDAPSIIPGVNITGDAVQTSPVGFGTFWAWGFDCFGGGGVSSTPAGAGGGGGVSSATGVKAGVYGGAGGLHSSTTGATGNRGPGQSVYNSSGTITSGAGDNGCAIFVLRV